MTEQISELLSLLRDEDNCNVLDYIDDAADLIESLSAELEEVKRERDAAVEDLNVSRMCKTCAHYGDDDFISKRCINCASHCLWQWRGPQEAPHD